MLEIENVTRAIPEIILLPVVKVEPKLVINVTELIVEKQAAIEERPKILAAYIKSISSLGEVEIEFNTTIKDNFNMSLINGTYLDMFIQPAKDRHKHESEFNLTSLNFTWHVTYFNISTLKI